MNDFIFCLECCKQLSYSDISVEEEYEDFDIHGIQFKACKKIARCNYCNNEVYVASLNDLNVDLVKSVYEEVRNGQC